MAIMPHAGRVPPEGAAAYISRDEAVAHLVSRHGLSLDDARVALSAAIRSGAVRTRRPRRLLMWANLQGM